MTEGASRLTQKAVGIVLQNAQANSRAAVRLKDVLKQPSYIRIKSPESKRGLKSDFSQALTAIYVNGDPVTRASQRTKGLVEITVAEQVYKNDIIYLIFIEPHPNGPSGGSPHGSGTRGGGSRGAGKKGGKRGGSVTKPKKHRNEPEPPDVDSDDDDDNDDNGNGGSDNGQGGDDGGDAGHDGNDGTNGPGDNNGKEGDGANGEGNGGSSGGDAPSLPDPDAFPPPGRRKKKGRGPGG